KPGDDFNDLKPGYVIFICTFDPFGKGLYRYTFEERCLEYDMSLGDDTRKIFLNTRGRNDEDVPKELVHFLKYMEQSNDEYVSELTEESIRKLHEKVTELKKWRRLEAGYMTLEEWLNDQLEARFKARVEEELEDRVEEKFEALVKAQMTTQVEERVAASCEKASQEARREGKQEDILELLEEYGAIPEHIREAVLAQKDLEVLKRWLKLAAGVGSIEQFEKEM
ncbi:MAG: hypothetical protein HDR01_07540, partial [Lachnospiraceae bacterium]|nr:hypothetical protein [Lachnospiraceae bacterium]